MRKGLDPWRYAVLERFLITLHHGDARSTAHAIATAYSVCQREECDAVICVPNKEQAHVIALNEVIPEETLKRMRKGEPFLYQGVKFWLESLGTLKRSGRSGALIALYTPLQSMKLFEEAGWKAIIYLPWMPEEGVRWKAQWGPELVPAGPAKGDRGGV